MSTKLGKLYHLAEEVNLPSILQHGLMSAERLLELAAVPEMGRSAVLRTHRSGYLRLSGGIVIRDQGPMPPNALAPALDDGLEPSDWYALVNSFVFFWADRERMLRLRSAISRTPQTLLVFDGHALIEKFHDRIFVSAINVGNARRKPARRGLSTIVPYSTWKSTGWPNGHKNRHVAELMVKDIVPASAPYLLDVAQI